MTTVETNRLLLRIPESADAAPLLTIHEDPKAIGRVQVTATQGGLPIAWRNVAYMVGHWQLRGFGEWTIVEKASGEVIGRVGFSYPDGAPAPELGWIIRSDRWGQRFASEAARAGIAWFWANTTIPFAISTIAPDNVPSLRIAKRLGGIEQRGADERGESLIFRYARPG